MIIDYIYLENYGAFRKADFNFQEGFNVLEGENGQGKSHVIRAINYALLNKNFGNIDNDCNWNADGFTIHLKLSHLNKHFDIFIEYTRKGGTSKKLWIDDEYYQGGTEVNNALAQYFEPNQTQAGIMSLQGKMDVVDATDSERRDNLKRIYNLDFSKEVEQLKEEKEQLKSTKEDIDKEIYSLENKDYTPRQFKEYPFNKEDYVSYRQEIETLEEKKKQQEQHLKEQERIKNDLQYFNQQIRNLDSKYQDTDNKINQNDQAIDKAERDYNNKIDSIDNDIKDKQNQINSIQLKRLKTFDYDNLHKKEVNLTTVYAELYEAENELELIDQGQCPKCKRPFHSSDRQEYQRKYDEVRGRYDSLKKTVDDLQKEKEQYEIEKEEQQKLRHDKERLQEQIDNLYSQKEEIEKNYNERVDYLQNDKRQKEQELQEIKEQYDEVLSKIKELQTQVDDIDDTDYQGRIDELWKYLQEYDSVKQENEFIEKENKQLAEQQEKDKEALETKKKEKDKLNKQIEEYRVSADILRKDFPNFVISNMVSELESGMNELLEKAYNGRYSISIEETKKGLSVRYGSNKEDIKLASGAEKNLFNIGFKNAFSKIAGLKNLLLDEADAFMDNEIARNTFQTIHSLIESNNLEQVIVITHKQSVKDLLEADYYAKVFKIQEGAVVDYG
jgi:DNA repair exonuclease SbcCD ATPase subunit